ncbi:glucoamylase family protein [Shumkonia mesophila]|uniref:glucoamylase family protein n=1 Tax=Shumkonia mesophila TaxID=2838854 RepID=UPI0029350998|nr:glucoamylase family protein [Shumkonia mesophila]
MTDEELLDLVQRRTLGYFWDFAHPKSGMARERSNPVPAYGYDYRTTVTSGGTGFGIMAMLAGATRGFLPRGAVIERIRGIVAFLERAPAYHGVFPHFLDGATGATIPFSPKDDGGDLVETAFLMEGLLCARQFFDGRAPAETGLREAIDRLWHAVDWKWHTRGNGEVLYWHWSPNHGWAMNHAIRGWDEALIAYVLAAASPTHPVASEVYHRGWAGGATFRNGHAYHDLTLPLGPPGGGPLFYSHYSFLGLDPRGLTDRYADYWQQNVAHTLINRAHCIANPHGHAGYGPPCWGLTSCDGDEGYRAFNPENDRGVIAPTAALSAMPYTPEHSMAALRHFHEDLGDRIWGEFGFRDSFNRSRGWVAPGHLAIDQGPIVVMIENHRSGLLWDLFMGCPEVAVGLKRLDFESPRLAAA